MSVVDTAPPPLLLPLRGLVLGLLDEDVLGLGDGPRLGHLHGQLLREDVHDVGGRGARLGGRGEGRGRQGRRQAQAALGKIDVR